MAPLSARRCERFGSHTRNSKSDYARNVKHISDTYFVKVRQNVASLYRNGLQSPSRRIGGTTNPALRECLIWGIHLVMAWEANARREGGRSQRLGADGDSLIHLLTDSLIH
jgi:hypothetical protein